MSSITMRSAITRGRAISCCSLGVRTSTTRSPFDVASDWADSCVTTIRRQRKKRGTRETYSSQQLGDKIQHRINAQESNATADLEQPRKQNHVHKTHRIGN